MHLDPACLRASEALAAGEPVDPAHLARCAGCAGRARLAASLLKVQPAIPVRSLPAPEPAGLSRALFARRARAAAVAGVVAAGIVAGFAALPTSRPPADLLAAVSDTSIQAETPPLLDVLDEAERALGAPPVPGDELLALLDPREEPPSPHDDPTLDALLGEGDL